MLKSYLKLIKNIFQVIRGILSYYHKDKYFYIKIYSILNIFSFKKSYYISLRASETGVAIGHQMTANCCSRPLSSLRGKSLAYLPRHSDNATDSAPSEGESLSENRVRGDDLTKAISGIVWIYIYRSNPEFLSPFLPPVFRRQQIHLRLSSAVDLRIEKSHTSPAAA